MRPSPYLQWFLVIIGAFFLTGCPYLSEIPLNSANTAKLDTTIIGSWQKSGSEIDSAEILHILQFNSIECLVLIWEEKEISVFRAFSTSIRGHNFLNICEIQPDLIENFQYIFAEYQIENDRMELRFVEDDLFTGKEFSNPGILSDFIGNKLDNDSLFGETESFTRSEKTQLKR
jgi:hypothetical protein